MGPQGITSAPQLLKTKTSQVYFLSRLVKLNEVFRTVISCLELKIAILSKFIESYGFTIPEQLLFLAFISCAQHQQNCYKFWILPFSWSLLGRKPQEALAFSGQILCWRRSHSPKDCPGSPGVAVLGRVCSGRRLVCPGQLGNVGWDSWSDASASLWMNPGCPERDCWLPVCCCLTPSWSFPCVSPVGTWVMILHHRYDFYIYF